MPNQTVETFLKNNSDACNDGKEFANQFTHMSEVWDKCARIDWLLWILAREKIELPVKVSVTFACWCARNTPLGDGRTSWDLLTDERSKQAIIITEKWLKGEVTIDEVSAAARAAYAAAEAAREAYMAEAAREARAARAAYAAAEAARAAYMAYAAREARAAQCDYIRTLIPNPFL